MASQVHERFKGVSGTCLGFGGTIEEPLSERVTKLDQKEKGPTAESAQSVAGRGSSLRHCLYFSFPF